MSRARFIRGALLEIERREFTLLRTIRDDHWQAEASDNGEIRTFSREDLLVMYLEGRCKFVMDMPRPRNGGRRREANAQAHFDNLPPHRKEAAKARLAYVKAIETELGPNPSVQLLEQVAKKVHQKLKWPTLVPHQTTLWRWVKKYNGAGQDARALVDRVANCGNRASRIDAELAEVIADSCREIYLTEERRTYNDTLDHALLEVHKRNQLRLPSELIPLPKLKQVKRFIEAIPAYDRHAARHGKDAANRMFRTVTGSAPVSRALECLEIDHTRMDIFVIDEETMLPLGRPWLSLAVDRKTKCIHAYDLSFEPPSQGSVARCLAQALLPKKPDDCAGAKNPWEMYGVVETLVVDNGLEFHSTSLEMACLALGITLQYCPRATPWYKGCVERTLGTLNRGVAHASPGTTFSNIVDRGDYDPSKHAVATLRSLRQAINVWICDLYHARVHRTLRDTPRHAWEIETKGTPIPVPADPVELRAHLAEVTARKLSHKGVELHGLFYNSTEMGEIARQEGHGTEVSVRFHRDDLGSIHVLSPISGRYIEVRAIDWDYANGLTAWQHSICKRFAAKSAEDRVDRISLAEAKERIRELIQQDFASKKRRARVKSARFLNSPRKPAADEFPDAKQSQAPSGSPCRPETPALAAPKPDGVDDAPIMAMKVPRRSEMSF